jgi:CRISPR-associated protein (TIGR03986 family)
MMDQDIYDIPVQNDEIDDDRIAFAPYNFVPLPDDVLKISVDKIDQGTYQSKDKSHTGHILCELTTESPIYTRAAKKPGQAKKDKEITPDFFYLKNENEPVIPGSSLRGLFRTLMEIATFSKVTAVSSKRLFYRAVGGTTNHDISYRAKMMRFDKEEDTIIDGKHQKARFYTPKIKGGYIVKEGNDWAIQPAKMIDGTTYAHISLDDIPDDLQSIGNSKNSFRIFIRTSPYEYKKVLGGFLMIRYAKVLDAKIESKVNLRLAALCKSGEIDKKESEAVIYEPDNVQKPILLSDDLLDEYKEQMSNEQKKLLDNTGEKDEKRKKDGDNIGVLKQGHPIFYITKEDNEREIVFFGHARMFRVPYLNNPLDYVPEWLRNEEEVDMTEAIFGFTEHKGKVPTLASRLSFSDATIMGTPKWLNDGKPVTLKILSEPKPTSFQHYLVQTHPNLYKVKTEDGKIKDQTVLSNYSSEPGETVIRGHKFYWHKGQVGLGEIQEKNTVNWNTDTQHTQVKPLDKGNKFRFKIRFENLSGEELGAILWILYLAAANNCRLKIGMGKPLGMGAIKIVYELFLQDSIARYSTLFDKYGHWTEYMQSSNDKVETIRMKFLDFMKAHLKRDFQKHPRIKSLIYMLQWPGILSDKDGKPTRYMEIRRPVPNGRPIKEYQGRPVLPSPFGVWSKHKK